MAEPIGGAAPITATGAPGTSTGNDEDKEPINRKEFAKRLNKMNERNEAKFAEFTSSFKTMFDELKTSLTAAPSGGAPAGDPPAGNKGASRQAGIDISSDPLVKRLQKDSEDLRKSLEETQKQLGEERSAAKTSRLKQTVREALVTAGVEERRVKAALAVLTEDKRYRYSDDDEPVFLDDDAEYDVPSGITKWLKTDEGKDFLPPRGTRGSGDRPTGGSPGRTRVTGEIDKGEVTNALASILTGGDFRTSE